MTQFESDSNNELTPSTDKRLKKERGPTIDEINVADRACEYVAGDLSEGECPFL